jgi:hypothetical protein
MSNGINGSESRTVNKHIVKLANDGKSIAQIADGVGMTSTAVACRMTTLMRNGKLKPYSERTGRINTEDGRYRILRKRYNRNTGSIMEILTNITFDEASWIYKTAPEGLTIAEWIGVLLRDVIAEENDNDQRI